MYNISLIPKEKIHTIIPLIRILNQNLNEDLIRSRLEEMVSQNYHCVGVYHHERLIGISGLWILTKLYVGRHIEPDNVIIDPEYRSQGVGERLMKWIYDYGKSKGCIASELNCYIGNDRGQKFWLNEGYRVIGSHFQKKL